MDYMQRSGKCPTAAIVFGDILPFCGVCRICFSPCFFRYVLWPTPPVFLCFTCRLFLSAVFFAKFLKLFVVSYIIVLVEEF